MTNETLKRHLISAAVTFVGTFVSVFALAISVETFEFTRVSLIALVGSTFIAAVRAAAKIIYEGTVYLVGKKNK